MVRDMRRPFLALGALALLAVIAVIARGTVLSPSASSGGDGLPATGAELLASDSTQPSGSYVADVVRSAPGFKVSEHGATDGTQYLNSIKIGRRTIWIAGTRTGDRTSFSAYCVRRTPHKAHCHRAKNGSLPPKIARLNRSVRAQFGAKWFLAEVDKGALNAAPVTKAIEAGQPVSCVSGQGKTAP